MSNAPAAEHPAGWSSSDGVLVAPIPAQHGSSCLCRGCANEGYGKALAEIASLRSDVYRLREQLRKAERANRLSEYRRLTLVIAAAVATDDHPRWARAVNERMALGLSALEAEQAEQAEQAL